jgi:hypothetical protein
MINKGKRNFLMLVSVKRGWLSGVLLMVLSVSLVFQVKASSPKLHIYMLSQASDNRTYITDARNMIWAQTNPIALRGNPVLIDPGYNLPGSPDNMFFMAAVGREGWVGWGKWSFASFSDSSNGAWGIVPGGIRCQSGIGATIVDRTMVVVCATLPDSNGISQIVLNTLDVVTSIWGNWRVIGGWTGINTDLSIPAPSLSNDGNHVAILAQSPTALGVVWFNMYSLANGVSTPWQRFITSCLTTPGITSTGNDRYLIACVARDTGSIYLTNLISGSHMLDKWMLLSMPSNVHTFTDSVAVDYDRYGKSETIAVSGLGIDGASYFSRISATLPFSISASWQQSSVSGFSRFTPSIIISW